MHRAQLKLNAQRVQRADTPLMGATHRVLTVLLEHTPTCPVLHAPLVLKEPIHRVLHRPNVLTVHLVNSLLHQLSLLHVLLVVGRVSMQTMILFHVTLVLVVTMLQVAETLFVHPVPLEGMLLVVETHPVVRVLQGITATQPV